MTHAGLLLENVSYEVDTAEGRIPVLREVSGHFSPGESALITGPVGAGKSCLIQLIAGLGRPTEGTVIADGRPISRFTAPHRDQWRRDVGIVFQQLSLLEQRTVLENVMLPLIPRRGRHRDKVMKAELIIERLGLTPLSKIPVSGLSGGERQKTAVARALAAEPRFLFADEPSAHLDDDSVALVLGLFRERAEAGAVVVVVSHDPRLAADDCFVHRLVLNGGHLEEGA